MEDTFTTHEVQQLLRVDRTTIYRMLRDGRLSGFKVGNRWRFPRQAIEALLPPAMASPHSAGGPFSPDVDAALPLECASLVVDFFATTVGLTSLIADLQGQPITEIHNASPFCRSILDSPSGKARCVETWRAMAAAPHIEPRPNRCHAGLSCVRGLIRVREQLVGMVIADGFVNDGWTIDDDALAAIAQNCAVDLAELRANKDTPYRFSGERYRSALTLVQRIADIFSYMGSEWTGLLNRLRDISSLSQV
jgi:excisionase family DNA binding protein